MTDRLKRRIAFIGIGGTISSVGRDSLDVWEYMDAGEKIGPDDLLARFPERYLQNRGAVEKSGRG